MSGRKPRPPGSAFDQEALLEALERKRLRKDLSWREVGRQAGISAATLNRIVHGGPPDVDRLVRLLDWLGAPTEAFLRRSVATGGDAGNGEDDGDSPAPPPGHEAPELTEWMSRLDLALTELPTRLVAGIRGAGLLEAQPGRASVTSEEAPAPPGQFSPALVTNRELASFFDALGMAIRLGDELRVAIESIASSKGRLGEIGAHVFSTMMAANEVGKTQRQGFIDALGDFPPFKEGPVEWASSRFLDRFSPTLPREISDWLRDNPVR